MDSQPSMADRLLTPDEVRRDAGRRSGDACKLAFKTRRAARHEISRCVILYPETRFREWSEQCIENNELKIEKTAVWISLGNLHSAVRSRPARPAT